MDDIINRFEKLSTNKDEIDDLIIKISNIDIYQDLEWNKLQKNYSRLKHFKKIVKDCTDFQKPFLAFMEKIDQINKYYIKNINLDPESYIDNDGYNLYDISSIKDIIKIINECLETSINSDNPATKLDYVLIAYSNIILLIDDFSGEKCIKYNHSIKRRKFT
jgi:hypothetical protein